jgi:hypothetical protein
MIKGIVCDIDGNPGFPGEFVLFLNKINVSTLPCSVMTYNKTYSLVSSLTECGPREVYHPAHPVNFWCALDDQTVGIRAIFSDVE